MLSYVCRLIRWKTLLRGSSDCNLVGAVVCDDEMKVEVLPCFFMATLAPLFGRYFPLSFSVILHLCLAILVSSISEIHLSATCWSTPKPNLRCLLLWDHSWPASYFFGVKGRTRNGPRRRLKYSIVVCVKLDTLLAFANIFLIDVVYFLAPIYEIGDG